MVVNDNEGGIKVDGKVRRDAKYPAGLMGNSLSPYILLCSPVDGCFNINYLSLFELDHSLPMRMN